MKEAEVNANFPNLFLFVLLQTMTMDVLLLPFPKTRMYVFVKLLRKVVDGNNSY